MSLFDLFEPRSVPASYSPFRWGARAPKPVEGDTGLERFASPRSAVPVEISAAGLTTSDLSQSDVDPVPIWRTRWDMRCCGCSPCQSRSWSFSIFCFG